MEHIEPHDASASKPHRRKVTVALSLNRELVKQLDEFARNAVMTRSAVFEQVILGWMRAMEESE